MVETSDDLMDRQFGFIWKILSFPQKTKLLSFTKTYNSHRAIFTPK